MLVKAIPVSSPESVYFSIDIDVSEVDTGKR
jgi:hypothetical protein